VDAVALAVHTSLLHCYFTILLHAASSIEVPIPTLFRLMPLPAVVVQHFAMSLGRHGVDFRGLLPPLFEKAALRQYQQKIEQAASNFANGLPSASLVTHSLSSSRQAIYDGASPL